jgi:proteasome lid subunit RPN8/RPN11
MTGRGLAKPLRFVLPQSLRQTMVRQALEECPNECCGLLAGKRHGWGWEAAEVFPLVNELKSATRFRSEPQSLLSALRLVEHRGLDVVGIYHSHPDSQAIPSRIDLAWRWADGVADLIISLAGEVPEVRAWSLGENDFEELQLALDLSLGNDL